MRALKASTVSEQKGDSLSIINRRHQSNIISESRKNEYFISVITICKNSESIIARTLYSISKQTFNDFEVVIIDGNSEDNTLGIINQYHLENFTVISENDAGIYDAMNKGIKYSKGIYIIFMNSGDEFYDKSALEHLAAAARKSRADFVGGKEIVLNKYGSYMMLHEMNHNQSMLLHQLPFGHQALMYKKQMHKSFGLYDTSYAICADVDFILKAYAACQSFYAIHDIVSYFYFDGKSFINPDSVHREFAAARIKNFKIQDEDFKHFLINIHTFKVGELINVYRKYKHRDGRLAIALNQLIYMNIFGRTYQQFDEVFTVCDEKMLYDGCDRVACVLGNGPSLRGFDFKNELAPFFTFGMNAAFRYWDRLGWYPNYYSCLDLVVGMSLKEDILRLIRNWKRYGIARFLLRHNLIEWLGEDYDSSLIDDFDQLQERHPVIFGDYMVTTGSATLAWAAYLGFKDILLAGIDANYVNYIPEAVKIGETSLEIKKTPAHNPNYFFDGYQIAGDKFQVPNWKPEINLHAQSWNYIGDYLRTHDIHVINTNINSNVNAFMKIPWEDSLKILLKMRISMSDFTYLGLAHCSGQQNSAKLATHINLIKKPLNIVLDKRYNMKFMAIPLAVPDKVREFILSLDASVNYDIELEFFASHRDTRDTIFFCEKFQFDKKQKKHIEIKFENSAAIDTVNIYAGCVMHAKRRIHILIDNLLLKESRPSLEARLGFINDDQKMACVLLSRGDAAGALGLYDDYCTKMNREPDKTFLDLCARRLGLAN